MQPFGVQLLDLTLIQFTNWRWSWRGTILTGLFAPLFMMGALHFFAQDSGVVALGYVLTGNMVLSLLLQGIGNISGHFMFMRMNGTLDYFATLPISRVALVIATAIAFLVLSLPATFATLFLGKLLLQIPLALSPALLLVIPIISLSLSGLGAFLGVIARTPNEVNSLSTLANLFLVSFGPVLIPADRLPAWIEWASLLSPATYAASALRHVVLGTEERFPLWVSLLILSGLAVFWLSVVNARLDWRNRSVVG